MTEKPAGAIFEGLGMFGAARAAAAPLSLHAEGLPEAHLYYSIGGEDVALLTRFKRRIRARKPGIYVDIGGALPIRWSNTYIFYCYGWSGVAIDANPTRAPEWARLRPRDRFVAAVAGEGAARAYLFAHPTNGGMHQISLDPALPGPEFVLAGTVPMRRLDDVLAESFPGGASIQFFSIDVEGSELGVLRSNDWERWRPEVIMMECHDFRFDDPRAAPTVAFLMDQGYRLTAKVGANVMMEDTRAAGGA